MVVFFQAEDGIRGLVRSRGLGDVYKRQVQECEKGRAVDGAAGQPLRDGHRPQQAADAVGEGCLLYTSDAADDLPCVDFGGRRIIKKKTNHCSSSP